jgi:hypothetical protein
MLELQRGALVTEVNDAEALAAEQPLWMAVNRYRPRKSQRGGKGQALTVIAGHANGMSKEVSLSALDLCAV